MVQRFAELATLAGTMAGVEWARGRKVWQVFAGEDRQFVARTVSEVSVPDSMLSP